MKRIAKEFVALQPDLIFTVSTPATAIMLQQTRTIPIMFVLVADPIGSGFVTNLSRPGRQRDWVHSYRGYVGREVGGSPQRDCTGRRQGLFVV
jgi:hypothetical protein